MICYQALKYLLLDSCVNTFFDKFLFSLRVNVPPSVIPRVGDRFRQILGPHGQELRNMICKHIMPANEIHFNNNPELDAEFRDSEDNVYLFSKEGNAMYDNVVFIELMLGEAELSQWIFIQ